jgi:hypothetical protein
MPDLSPPLGFFPEKLQFGERNIPNSNTKQIFRVVKEK